MSGNFINFIGNNAVQVDAKAAEATMRQKYPLLLHAKESIELAFKGRGGLGRDKSYFTSHRILLKKSKSVDSKRKTYVSLPFASIQAFSVETAGKCDGDFDLKVWGAGTSCICIDFAAGGGVDIFDIQQLLNTKMNWAVGVQASDVHKQSVVTQSNSSKPSCFKDLVEWMGKNDQQLSPGAVEQQFKKEYPVLMEQEAVQLAFKPGRDLSVFTDKRYLAIDVQSVLGRKKVVFKSFPWRCFSGFSIETARAFFDRDSVMKLYTNIADIPFIDQDFRNSSADGFAIQKFITNQLLGADSAPLAEIDFIKQYHVDPKAGWWFNDSQRPLDAAEMNMYYHETVPLLQGSEQVEVALKGRRGINLFTSKRIVLIDPQGSGVKIQYSSIPWKSVVAFGVKTAGKHLDSDCEALIYTDMMFDPPHGVDDPPRPGMSFRELDFNRKLFSVIAMKRYLATRCLQHASSNTPVPSNVPVCMKSGGETSLRMLLSKVDADEKAPEPAELNTLFHTRIPLLLEGENIIMPFAAGHDMTVFTNLRILVFDTQGWSEDKAVYRSVSYASIRAFSVESAGGWDRDAGVDIYTRNLWSLKKLQIDFREGKVDISVIQKLLAVVVLGNHEEAERYLQSREPAIKQAKTVDLKSLIAAFVTERSKEEDASAVDAELHDDAPILLDNEHVVRAFRSGRDMYVYTNLRLLLVDVQGLRGERIEYKSFPWKWCQGYEIRTVGHVVRDAELTLHCDIPARRCVKHNIFVGRFDIHEMQSFLCSTLLFPIDAAS